MMKIFNNLNSSDWILRATFFCQFLLICWHSDPNIFAGPDPGSQNVSDPTDSDPDPKPVSNAQ